jgi:hypothetical protein
LSAEADSALPAGKTADDEQLRRLREKLLPAKQRGDHAN